MLDGKPVEETLGQINPLRYRGYVYDRETQLYYLQSRYYDPEVGRFLNSDVLVSTGQGILGNNMFAYCNNNPVNYMDANGKEAVLISVGIVVLGVVVLSFLVVQGTKTIYSLLQWISTQWQYAHARISFISKEVGTDVPNVTYPGDDPTKAPEGTEWRGKGEKGGNQGNYHNPETGESWHPDLDHPEPIGPHWDYRDPGGKWWRVGRGKITLK